RLARGADVLYASTLSSFPYCLLAGRLARVPQVVHVYSSYGDGAAYRKHLLGRARHVVAPSADSLALARRALGEFAAGTRARVVYNGMDVERIARAAAAPLPAGVALGGGPTVGMVGHLDARKNPAVLVRGMALGRPIVASAVGGIPEMLEDGVSGCLVPPGDAPALAAAIAALLRDPARRARVGTAARERLATRFSLEGFAAGMFAAFDDAV